MMGMTNVRLRLLSRRVELLIPPRVLATIVLALCTAFFVQRGMLRGFSDARDFGTPYAQAGAWLGRENPYDNARISRAFAAAGADGDDYNTVAASFPAYPPSTLPLIAPMTLLPWSLARVIWVATLGTLILVCALCSVWLCGRSIRSAHGLIAFALITALAPVQTGLAKGNVSIASAAVGLIGLLLIQRGAAVTGGVLLGIGLALKPEVAIGFVALAIVIRRWRAVVGAIAVAALCWSIAALTRGNSVPGLFTAWADSISRYTTPGAINDASSANANRDQVISLVRLLSDFTPNMGLAQFVAVLAVSAIGLLVAVSAWRTNRSCDANSVVWPASALLVLSLLPIYHRFYDAALLALPVAAVVASTSYPRLRIRGAMAVALAFFLVPGGAMLLIADQGGWVPPTIQQSPLWISGVRAHEVWALCLLAILLTIATLRTASTRLTHPDVAAGLP